MAKAQNRLSEVEAHLFWQIVVSWARSIIVRPQQVAHVDPWRLMLPWAVARQRLMQTLPQVIVIAVDRVYFIISISFSLFPMGIRGQTNRPVVPIGVR